MPASTFRLVAGVQQLGGRQFVAQLVVVHIVRTIEWQRQRGAHRVWLSCRLTSSCSKARLRAEQILRQLENLSASFAASLLRLPLTFVVNRFCRPLRINGRHFVRRRCQSFRERQTGTASVFHRAHRAIWPKQQANGIPSERCNGQHAHAQHKQYPRTSGPHAPFCM